MHFVVDGNVNKKLLLNIFLSIIHKRVFTYNNSFDEIAANVPKLFYVVSH